MALVDTAIDERIRRELGESAVLELSRHLTAVDCQSCGRPIGSGQAALAVYPMGPTHAMASVHHRRCRPSGWLDTGPIRLGAGQNLSYRTFTFQMPTREGDTPTWTPTLLLNPSVELAFLDRDESGVWHVATVEPWTSRGLSASAWKFLGECHAASASCCFSSSRRSRSCRSALVKRQSNGTAVCS